MPLIIGGTVLGVAGLGAWLRWAVIPVGLAYRIGRYAGRHTAR
jgi:hypothetical protein